MMNEKRTAVVYEIFKLCKQRNAAVAGVASRSNIKAGSNFTYDLVRNNEYGGVSITVGNNTEVYRYGSKPTTTKR